MIERSGPLLMLTGLCLLLLVFFEATGLAIFAKLGWSQSANLAIAGIGLVSYLAGLVSVTLSDGNYIGIGRKSATSSNGTEFRTSWRSFVFITSLVAFALVFIGLKQILIEYDPGYFFPDTLSYVQVANESVLSSEFWRGARPITLPLFYKALGVTAENVDTRSMFERIASIQAALSALSWLVLGLGALAITRSRTVGLASYGAVLLFGLNLHVSHWDRLLLSESISTSTFAFSLGFGLIGIRAAKHPLWRKTSAKAAFYLLLAVTLLLFCMARDSNLIVGLIAASFGLSYGLGLFGGAGRGRIWLLATSGIVLSALVAQLILLQRSDRWEVPLYHVLHDRILASEDATEFFLEAGMPNEGLVSEARHMDRLKFRRSLQNEPNFAVLKQWLQEHGRRTYVGFLLRKPVDLLASPFVQGEILIEGSTLGYRSYEAVTPSWLELTTLVAYPRSPAVFLGGGIICGLGIVGLCLRGQWAHRFFVPLLMLLSVYPLFLLAYHGDTIEIERHAYQAALQLRLGFLLMALWLADYGIDNLKKRRQVEVRSKMPN